MKSKNILDALNGIDYDLVEDAREKKGTKRSVWIRWIAAAACMCVIAGCAWVFPGLREGQESTATNVSGTESKDDGRLPIEGVQVSDNAPLFYGTEGSIGGSPSAEVDTSGISVTMKAVEMLPDSYTFYGGWRQNKFRLLRTELISMLKGKRMVEDFYLMIPEGYETDYTVYDVLFAEDLLQITYEISVLYNATQNCAEQINLPVFSWIHTSLMAFDEEGRFDLSLWHSTERWKKATASSEKCMEDGFNLSMAEERARNETYGADNCVTLLSDLSEETASVADRILNPENGIYAYYINYGLYGAGPTVQLTCRRYINGFATNEYVSIWGGYKFGGYEDGERTNSEIVKYSKASFTDEDLERLPNLSGTMQTVKEAFDAGQITPPHIQGYEDMEQESYGIFGWYAKTAEGVVGIVRVTFCYDLWYYDDAYYVIEYGAEECAPIARDDLLTLLGEYETTFVYDGEYDENGKTEVYPMI